MARLSNPIPLFLDARGALLDGGSIYIGDPGTDPAIPANRVDLFWNSARTIPAAQPLRTLGGVIVNANAPAFVYLAEDDYSIRINDADGLTVVFLPSVATAATQYQPLAAALTALSSQASTSFGRSLLNTADAAGLRSAAGVGSAALMAKGTAAEYRSNVANRALSTDQVWAAAVPIALMQSGGSVPVDMAQGLNFTLAMTGGAWTLAAPANAKPGQAGMIEITQDATGGRLLSFDSAWKFAGGTDPALSTAGNARDVLSFQVLSDGTVFASLSKGVA